MSESTTKLTVQEKVANGIEFLEEHYPGFRERVDKSTLSMRNGGLCMFAQASGLRYVDAVNKHGLSTDDAIRLGFDVSYNISRAVRTYAYGELEAEWLRQLA